MSKTYGFQQVFESISFLHSNGVLGIGGPNGSGKSTLMQCLAGLKRANTGHIRWKKAGREIDFSALQSFIGYAAPYINLYDELSCAENLRFILQLRGLGQKDERIEKYLQQTELRTLAEQPFSDLSTGQKQRLRIAAALIHQPSILFLDEPGSNLDQQGRVLVESIVEEFFQSGAMVFIASNNAAELALCNRIYAVDREKII